MCDNIQDCCRICLDVENNHVSILSDLTVNLHLRSCLAITVSAGDPLPKGICECCVSQLAQFYNFQINARCSQDWLEAAVNDKLKKGTETKTPIQPLPDSEYNSDSLLEFLNNTANIEEYLNNLGKEDIPSIVNLLDRNEHTYFKSLKQPSPKKKDTKSNKIDVLETDSEIIRAILKKEADPKNKPVAKSEKNFLTCYGCKVKFDSIQKMCQHVSTCDIAARTCTHCDMLFDSRTKMIEHSVIHAQVPMSCHCGQDFQSNEELIHHKKLCHSFNGMGIAFRCKECGVTFKDRFKLYRHARNHVIRAEEKKCDVCKLVFVGTEALMKHKKEHDKPLGTKYRCKVCQLILEDHSKMYLHVKSHTSKPPSSRHLCESCGKSFSSRTLLNRHSLQHNSNFNCNMCARHFNSQLERDAHMVVHSECAMCERCGNSVRCHEFDAHVCE